MSTSTQQDTAWSDFDGLRHSIKSYTVDRLKQIINGLVEECSAQLSKSGKKQDLIDRIIRELDNYRVNGKVEYWHRARAVLHQVRTSGTYTSAHYQGFSPHRSYPPTHRPPTYPHANGTVNGQSPGSTASSHIARYDPYAPPRRAVPSSSVTSSPVKPMIRFKTSPFYRIDQMISSVVECPESTGSTDRRSQNLYFSLTQDHISKLSQSSSKYQVRLYCTTNTFYNPSPSGFRTVPQLPCPIEFPATCEVRTNNTLLQANLKGIKKKPGTAPPADLSKLVRTTLGSQNKVEMIYVNSQANATPKKFFLVAFLVEVSSVDQLIDRLRKGKYRTSDDIRTQMLKANTDDDEIVVGKQKMTLKCPLSYTRIKIPCRSDKCVHPQCFDAFSWYSVMEQTTTWLCPVCEKILNPEELIVDGYFEDILKQTPESVEEVEVEPDGEWHTSDNTYGSETWTITHRSRRANAAPETRSLPPSQDDSRLSSPKQKCTTSSARPTASDEVVVLDSDSDNDGEDEGRVKQELSPSISAPLMSFSMVNELTRSNNAAPASKKASTIIDLTLDSDPEDAPPPRPVVPGKRKVDEMQLSQDRESSPRRMRSIDASRPTTSAEEKRRFLGTPTTGTIFPTRTLPPLGPRTPIIAAPGSISISAPGQSPTAPYDQRYSTYPTSPTPNQHPYAVNGSDGFVHSHYSSNYSQHPLSNGAPIAYSTSNADPRQLPSHSSYNPYLPRGNESSWP